MLGVITTSSASGMRRRWVEIQQVVWQQLRFSGTQEMEARIQQEVRKALARLGLGESHRWVAISRVSSLLSDDARESLADVGGLARFCRLHQDADNAQFAVKLVDGVLCLRTKGDNNHKKNKNAVIRSVRAEQENDPDTELVLQRISKVLPVKAATLDGCRRCWKLPTVSETVRCVTLLMDQLNDILKRCPGNCTIPMYLRVGYNGKQPAFVMRGPKLVCVMNQGVKGFEGCSENVEEKNENALQWLDEDFAHPYDLCRMSRFLFTDRFTSVDEVKLQTSGILQVPFLQVAMTYPERISLQLGPSINAEAAVDNRFYMNGASCTEVHEVLGLKFLLSEEEVSRHLKSSSRLSTLTDEQLSDERLKLKELLPLRRQKLRRSLVREEFRRRYPHGNVFLNPDVVAFYIYDLMTPGVWVNNANVRETMLPDGGKGSMHVGVDFFDQFPDLFITQGITTTSVNVMRREQTMESVQSDDEIWKRGSFRDEDILLSLLPRLCNKKEDLGEKSLQVLLTLLPRHVFKHMKRRGNTEEMFVAILQRYPEAFELTQADKVEYKRDDYKVRLHYDGIEKLGVRLMNELQAADSKSGHTRKADDNGDRDHGGSGGK